MVVVAVADGGACVCCVQRRDNANAAADLLGDGSGTGSADFVALAMLLLPLCGIIMAAALRALGVVAMAFTSIVTRRCCCCRKLGTGDATATSCSLAIVIASKGSVWSSVDCPIAQQCDAFVRVCASLRPRAK